MKKWIYLLLFAIVGLVCYTIFYNAKTHVQAVEVVEELVVKTDSLSTTVKVLHKEKDSVLTQIEVLDSTLTLKNWVIFKQSNDLNTLKKDTAALKRIGPIIIHDTVYVTETKNFWGKKKMSVESVSYTDTLKIEEVETDTIE